MRSAGRTHLDATTLEGEEIGSEPADAEAVLAAPEIAEHEVGGRDAAAQLIECLIVLGETWPGDEHMRRRLIHASVAHGMYRRKLGDAEDAIFGDYDRLRRALWTRIRRTSLPPGSASTLIAGIDAAISLAVAGSLRGYYRDVIARSGEWPLVLERLVWEWRHLDQHRS